jgi:hypothetical protein
MPVIHRDGTILPERQRDAPVMTRRQLYYVVGHVALGLALAVIVVRDLSSRDRSLAADFSAFYTGWTVVWRGQGTHLYEPAEQRRVQGEIMEGSEFEGGLLAFLQPPHAAALFSPLAALDRMTAFRLWTALQLLAAFALLRALMALAGPLSPTDRRLVMAAFIAFAPLALSLRLGQVSVLLALALARFALASLAAQDVRAGLWLVVLTIKPQFLPLLLLHVALTGRWRTLASFAAGAGLCLVVGEAVLGPGATRSYVVGLRALEDFFGSGRPDWMFNLRGALTQLLGDRHRSAIYVAALTALALGGVLVARGIRRDRNGHVPAATTLSRTLSLALILSPHLFLQDALSWPVALALFRRGLHDRAIDSARFDTFALAWPLALVFAATTVGRAPWPVLIGLLPPTAFVLAGRRFT